MKRHRKSRPVRPPSAPAAEPAALLDPQQDHMRELALTALHGLLLKALDDGDPYRVHLLAKETVERTRPPVALSPVERRAMAQRLKIFETQYMLSHGGAEMLGQDFETFKRMMEALEGKEETEEEEAAFAPGAGDILDLEGGEPAPDTVSAWPGGRPRFP